ncbi:MAG: PBECR4 domain-containing protein [Culicoidibacterales bacterium]
MMKQNELIIQMCEYYFERIFIYEVLYPDDRVVKIELEFFKGNLHHMIGAHNVESTKKISPINLYEKIKDGSLIYSQQYGINQYRINAFLKSKEILESPNIYQGLGSTNKQPNIIFNLSSEELDDESKSPIYVVGIVSDKASQKLKMRITDPLMKFVFATCYKLSAQQFRMLRDDATKKLKVLNFEIKLKNINSTEQTSETCGNKN